MLHTRFASLDMWYARTVPLEHVLGRMLDSCGSIGNAFHHRVMLACSPLDDLLGAFGLVSFHLDDSCRAMVFVVFVDKAVRE